MASTVLPSPIIALAYNTSYVNDAHYSILHPGLSESAAIIQKAIEYYDIPTLGDDGKVRSATDIYSELTEADGNNNLTKTDGNNNLTKADGNPTLENFRLLMADKNTEYIAAKLNDPRESESVDFMALTEQTIHVGEGNLADYSNLVGISDNHKLAKYDLSKIKVENTNNVENTNYGILRRIQKLNKLGAGLVDLNVKPPGDDAQAQAKYTIVYDNVVNTELLGAAEGISIIMNNQKYPKDKLITWTRNKLPVLQQLTNKYNASINVNTEQIYFFADDLGNVIESKNKENINQNDDDTGTPNPNYIIRKYSGNRFIPDMGRPIMLTACDRDDGLFIFVSVHSVNLYQLRAIKKSNYDTIQKQEAEVMKIDEELNPLIDTKNKAGEGFETDQLSQLRFTIAKLTANKKAITDEHAKVDMVKTLVRKDHSENNNPDPNNIIPYVCTAICEGIGKFITTAFANANGKQFENKKPVYVLMGGDFNDSGGHILDILNKIGITFTINSTSYTVKFPEQTKDIFGKRCCANADSVSNANDSTTLGPMNENTVIRILGDNKNNKGDNKNNKAYPSDFINPQKFNYYGDYALVGVAAQAGVNPQSYNIQVESLNQITPTLAFTSETNTTQITSETNTKQIYPSDHLPVFAIFTPTPTTTGGRKRRMYSRKRRNASFTKRYYKNKSRRSIKKRRRFSRKPLNK